jgi:hypothetical protein
MVDTSRIVNTFITEEIVMFCSRAAQLDPRTWYLKVPRGFVGLLSTQLGFRSSLQTGFLVA